jgi:hypothetical protein
MSVCPQTTLRLGPRRALHRNQEIDLSTNRAVWSPADIAVATREARRAEAGAARASEPPAEKAITPDCLGSVPQDPEPLAATEPTAATARYARIIRPNNKSATTGDGSPGVAWRDAPEGGSAADRAPRQRAAPTVDSVFGRPSEHRVTTTTSVSKEDGLWKGASAAERRAGKRSVIARQPSGFAPDHPGLDETDCKTRSRRTSRLSLPRNGRSASE